MSRITFWVGSQKIYNQEVPKGTSLVIREDGSEIFNRGWVPGPTPNPGTWSEQVKNAIKLDQSTFRLDMNSMYIKEIALKAGDVIYWLMDPKGFGILKPAMPAPLPNPTFFWSMRMGTRTPNQTTLGMVLKLVKLDASNNELKSWNVPGSGDYGSDMPLTDVEYNAGIKYLLEMKEQNGPGTVSVYWLWAGDKTGK